MVYAVFVCCIVVPFFLAVYVFIYCYCFVKKGNRLESDVPINSSLSGHAGRDCAVAEDQSRRTPNNKDVYYMNDKCSQPSDVKDGFSGIEDNSTIIDDDSSFSHVMYTEVPQ